MRFVQFISEFVNHSIYINENFVSGSGGIALSSIGGISAGLFISLLVIAGMYAVVISLKETEGAGMGVVFVTFTRAALLLLMGGVVVGFIT